MSRIGKQPVPIPDKVKVDIKDHTVHVEGPKGKVTKTFAPVVSISIVDHKVIVAPTADTSDGWEEPVNLPTSISGPPA